MKELTREEVLSYRDSGYLTVGQLKKFIEENNLPDDAIVVTQRVHDVYFEEHGWGVYKKHGWLSHNFMTFNKNLETGMYDDQEQYPDMTERHKSPYAQEDIDDVAEQYHPVWCPVKYNDEDDILFLDLHY